MFYRDQVEDLLMRVASLDRGFAFQLGFIVSFQVTVEQSCRLTWSEAREATGELSDYISRAPMDFSPYVFKYRSPSSLYNRYDACLKELGIQTDLRVKDLKEAWKHTRPRR